MKRIFAAFLLLAFLLTGCTPAVPTQTGSTGSTAGTTHSTQSTAPTQPSQSTGTQPGGEMTVHFIDVGQADCALLESEGEYILIDGGNVADGDLVVEYLTQEGVTKLEAVIATHAHEDHVGGLADVLATFETEAVYCSTRTYSSNCFDQFVYYTDQQGLEVTIPAPGDVIAFGDATATVLGPVMSYADPNDTSIVLMVDYGETSFLFTGDMETTAENDMLDYWGEEFDWHADVLKVGHHGSDTSTGYRFLNAVMPQYGVISVGTGNSYGHPHDGPLSKLRDADVTVYRTDELGVIRAVSDGSTVTMSWQDTQQQPTQPDPTNPTQPSAPEQTDPTEPTTQPQGQTFIGNKNSKKLHLPTCSSLPKEENRVYFDDYQAAIEAGYVPCSRCLGK